MEKYGFIYLWFDKKHKKYYLGRHWGSIDDGYICSSRNMRDNYRHRPLDFRRRIVSHIHTNREDLIREEQRWLNMVKKEELGSRYYNKTLKADCPSHLGKKHSEESKAKMSASHKGKRLSEETKEKISVATKGENNPYYGKKHTKEILEKMRQANLGRKHTQEHNEKISKMFTGTGNPFYGKKHNEETRNKLRYPKTEEHKEKLRQASKKYWENRING